MKSTVKKIVLVVSLIFFTSGIASANTIIKIDFGDSVPDIEYGGGILSSINDGNAGTAGDQNTNVLFEGVLGGVADIVGEAASFTVDNVTAAGAASVVAGLAIQSTTGGTFELYDNANALLLSATITTGSISGPVGGSATGSFVTLSFGTFTGGTLLPLIGDLTSAAIAISLTDVNGGAGLSVTGVTLDDFSADATANISAVPEPATMGLLFSGLLGGAVLRRRKT